jgi:hypothetical protein
VGKLVRAVFVKRWMSIYERSDKILHMIKVSGPKKTVRGNVLTCHVRHTNSSGRRSRMSWRLSQIDWSKMWSLDVARCSKTACHISEGTWQAEGCMGGG